MCKTLIAILVLQLPFGSQFGHVLPLTSQPVAPSRSTSTATPRKASLSCYVIHEYQSDMTLATFLFLILVSPKVLVHPYGILFLIKKPDFLITRVKRDIAIVRSKGLIRSLKKKSPGCSGS